MLRRNYLARQSGQGLIAGYGAPKPTAILQREAPPSDVLEVLWRRRWVVCGVAATCLAVAAVYLRVAAPVYTAESRLFVERVTAAVAGGGPDWAAQSKNYLTTQCELLRSAPILEGVVRDPEVRGMRMFAGAPDVGLSLKQRLTAEVGKKDDLITVSLDSQYPEEAERVVQRVVDSYVAYQAARKRSTAAQVLEFLQKKKDEREAELLAQRTEMLRFRGEHPELSFDDNGNIAIKRLARLQDELTAANLAALEAGVASEAAQTMTADPTRMRRLVEAESRQGSAAAAAAGDAADARLREELYRWQVDLKVAERSVAWNHPTLSTRRARVESLETQLAERDRDVVEAYVAAARQNTSTAQSKRDAIEKQYLSQQRQVLELNTVAAKLAVLDSAVRQSEKLVDEINTRIKALNLQDGSGTLDVTVLEPAKSGAVPTKPRVPLVLASAGLLGLVLGAGCAFVRATTDPRLRSVGEIAEAVGTPVLCSVPCFKGTRKAGPGDGRALQVHLQPCSPAAEAYRKVRTSVYFSNPHNPARTLVVTSPDEGDGKTTLACNLAIAMAQAGERTLLIDTDLRRPQLHELFAGGSDLGLSSVLGGIATLEAAVRETPVKRLDLLPCGPVPANPSEMLNSRRFVALLQQLAERYDRILLDAPPAAGLADALILGAMCDGTLLVVRAGKSERWSCMAACDGLASVGARLLGVVANGVRDRSSVGQYLVRVRRAKPGQVPPPPPERDLPYSPLTAGSGGEQPYILRGQTVGAGRSAADRQEEPDIRDIGWPFDSRMVPLGEVPPPTGVTLAVLTDEEDVRPCWIGGQAP